MELDIYGRISELLRQIIRFFPANIGDLLRPGNIWLSSAIKR